MEGVIFEKIEHPNRNPAMSHPSTDVAFTPSVKAVQERKGSRPAYRRIEERGGWRTKITPDLASFLAERDSAYLATASLAGQPYIQHRGGPKGFIRVIDEQTLAFADFSGNKQYITTGNLADNDRAYLFLMDYARRRRVKIWGRARVVEDAETIAKLMPADYPARPEQAIVFTVEAWDTNCPQHMPPRCKSFRPASRNSKRRTRSCGAGSVRPPLPGRRPWRRRRRSPRRRADEGRPTKVFDASVTAW
jgi:predicted pyridoxine 5'-phosphate oxidase superfamily flavin-nucleotide-binding protein